MGNGSLLWPEGCASLEEIPEDLSRAIEQANRICDWQENLMPEEVPPSWMWHLDHELKDWFEEVEFKRKEQRKNPSGADDDGWEKNEHARGRR